MLDQASSSDSLALLLAKLPEQRRKAILAQLTKAEAEALEWEWGFWARPKQRTPPGDWNTWLILAGRGFGKTRVGAEGVLEAQRNGAMNIALIGETVADTRKVMVEGKLSGILACSPPWNRPKYLPTQRILRWPNGAIATTYSAEEPDQLRGPQHDFAWGDEVAKWRYRDTWDQLQMGLRLGSNPRTIATTTPRPTPLIKELIAGEATGATAVTRGSTYENRANLAPKFIAKILAQYEGTRLGRQELYAELLDDAPGALWSRGRIEELRVKQAQVPALRRVVVAVDPAVTSNEDSDETGIVCAGLGPDGHAYVLEDGTLSKATPNQWAQQVIALYKRHNADRVVAEVNNGGDLVETNIRTADRHVSFSKVHASRGKAVRAEPIAALYEQGKVHHVGMFAALEDQMTGWDPAHSLKSPDRMDALVWALTELMMGAQPRTYEGLGRAKSSWT
jgi:phage terminase large subunit-like protein